MILPLKRTIHEITCQQIWSVKVTSLDCLTFRQTPCQALPLKACLGPALSWGSSTTAGNPHSPTAMVGHRLLDYSCCCRSKQRKKLCQPSTNGHVNLGVSCLLLISINWLVMLLIFASTPAMVDTLSKTGGGSKVPTLDALLAQLDEEVLMRPIFCSKGGCSYRGS